jgi:hypothetical protein
VHFIAFDGCTLGTDICFKGEESFWTDNLELINKLFKCMDYIIFEYQNFYSNADMEIRHNVRSVKWLGVKKKVKPTRYL